MKKKSLEEAIKDFKHVHGSKYDYSNVEYNGTHNKVCIICTKHGEYWQTPQKHLMGRGCPKCNTSKLEQTIKNLLKENNIAFEEQKHFKWLGKQSLDFYLPKQRIAIECQGIQHFEERKYFGGFIGLKNTIKRDKHKLELCIANNVKIIYYANYYYNFPYNVITNTVELLKEITMI